jgi:hypothetical protein
MRSILQYWAEFLDVGEAFDGRACHNNFSGEDIHSYVYNRIALRCVMNFTSRLLDPEE